MITAFIRRKISALKIEKFVLAVYLLVASLLMSAVVKAADVVPDGWESYQVRPDILTVQPQALSSDVEWYRLKMAQFSFVAFLLEAYHGSDIYFLARDAENLFDIARLATAGSDQSQRVKILNISRANMRDKLLKDYLSSQGLNAESLASGKKVVLIDTGFMGTIPNLIKEKFPFRLAKNIQTHLIISGTEDHPSARTFLVNLYPSANAVDPTLMHDKIMSYENLPRYTRRSSKFYFLDGQYEPLSLMDESASSERKQAYAYMQDLKHSWENSDFRQEFEKNRKLSRLVLNIIDGSESVSFKAQRIQRLIHRLPRQRDKILVEAMVRDLIEAKSESLQLKVEDFGFKVVDDMNRRENMKLLEESEKKDIQETKDLISARLKCSKLF